MTVRYGHDIIRNNDIIVIKGVEDRGALLMHPTRFSIRHTGLNRCGELQNHELE